MSDPARTNNTRASEAVTIGHPDLTVRSVSDPGSAQSGTAVTVSWIVGNDGTAEAQTSSWTDRLFLSIDDTLSADDLVLVSFEHAGPLAIGETASASLDVILPNGIEGIYHLIVAADAQDTVVEGGGAENDTAAASFTVILAPYADLALSAVTAAETIIGDPADLTVTWTVTNQGTGAGPVAAWTDRVVLSRDSILGNGDDRVVGNFLHDGAMPVGTQYTRTAVIQLAAATDGHFTLFVVADADDAVYEHTDTGANTGSPAHFVDIMPRPYADLVVSTVDVGAALTTGEPFFVTWTAANVGIGQTSTPEWFDDIYLADNPEATGAVRLARSSRVGNLAAGDAYTRTVAVTIPLDFAITAETTADRYLFVKTAAASGPYEFIHTANNFSEAAPVQVTYTVAPRSDLEIVSVSAPADASDGDAIDVEWKVRNIGPNDAEGSWTDIIYIAPNGDRDPGAEDRQLHHEPDPGRWDELHPKRELPPAVAHHRCV